MGSRRDPRTDEQLLAATATDPDAFGEFYERHLPAVLQFLQARTGRPELAADLAAEVFASALVKRRRFDSRRGSARSWLYVIARSKLLDSLRRGQVDDRARRRLEIAPLLLGDDDLARVEELAAGAGDPHVLALLAELPPALREAVGRRVLDERDYAEIAHELRCSEVVVRKRVSRGLAALRQQLTEGSQR